MNLKNGRMWLKTGGTLCKKVVSPAGKERSMNNVYSTGI